LHFMQMKKIESAKGIAQSVTIPLPAQILADLNDCTASHPLIKRATLARRALELGMPLLLKEYPISPKIKRFGPPETKATSEASH